MPYILIIMLYINLKFATTLIKPFGMTRINIVKHF